VRWDDRDRTAFREPNPKGVQALPRQFGTLCGRRREATSLAITSRAPPGGGEPAPP
jgi:hypothetical protein